jgi:putative ABC transport system permease protein
MSFLTFILKNVLRRPVRSLLTGLGIALAVGVVIAFVGIAYNFETSFAELYQKRKVDIMVTQAGVAQPEMGRLDETIGVRLQEVEGVQRVVAGLLESTSYPDRNLTMVMIQGWPADSPMFNDLKMPPGSERLQPGDKGKQRVMVSARLAETLGTKKGGQIDVLGKQFTIVGEFESFNVYENNSIILLLGDLQQLVGLPGKVGGFQIIAANSGDKEEEVKRMCAKIKELRDDKGQLLGLEARPTREYVESVPQIQMAKAMAWITSVIALIIGTVGMLNTMIMAVFERTREIGILRAIGWRKWRVMLMILGESMVLCIVGALLGTCGAVVLTRWLSTFAAASGFLVGTVPMAVVGQGFVIAVLVGLIGGVYPAYRGASLAPTEAIRHE